MQPTDLTCPARDCEATELVKTFPARFPHISCFYFKRYALVDSVEVRLNMKEVRSLAAESIQRLLERYADPKVLVDQMLKHADDNESSEWIEVCATDFPTRFLELQEQSRSDGRAVALCSFCRDKNDAEWHIPMMDFRIESGNNIGPQTAALLAAMATLHKKNILLKEDGVLLNSGNSFHYYGFTLLDRVNWIRFMTACLLLEPFVDVRYISHRLLAGRAALRITEVTGKKKTPMVIATVGHHFSDT